MLLPRAAAVSSLTFPGHSISLANKYHALRWHIWCMSPWLSSGRAPLPKFSPLAEAQLSYLQVVGLPLCLSPLCGDLRWCEMAEPRQWGAPLPALLGDGSCISVIGASNSLAPNVVKIREHLCVCVRMCMCVCVFSFPKGIC